MKENCQDCYHREASVELRAAPHGTVSLCTGCASDALESRDGPQAFDRHYRGPLGKGTGKSWARLLSKVFGSKGQKDKRA